MTLYCTECGYLPDIHHPSCPRKEPPTMRCLYCGALSHASPECPDRPTNESVVGDIARIGGMFVFWIIAGAVVLATVNAFR